MLRSVPTMKKRPLGEFDVPLCRLKLLRRDLAPLLNQALDTARDRCTADHQRARAITADT